MNSGLITAEQGRRRWTRFMSDRASRAAVERLLRRLDDVRCRSSAMVRCRYGAATGQPHVLPFTTAGSGPLSPVVALGRPTPGWG